MALGTIADGISRTVDAVAETLTAPFSDPVIRLGVTGLSRAGKTVFITSLVANLMNRGRMPQLVAAANGAIRTAYLQPQPDDTIPRFPYEDHLARLTAPEPRWPDGTRRISELRLSLRVQPTGLLSGLSGPRTVHLDIVDYPGEWLLDLSLLDKSFADWSAGVLSRIGDRPSGADVSAALAAIDPAANLDEPVAQSLADAFTAHLHAARDAGYSDCSPGRFLLPGDLEGSPVLTFAPLPATPGAGRRSLYREFERRFESYKKNVVKPFFRDHFARIDRQIVLVDVLGAVHAGPRAVEDLRHAMAEILSAFRPGRNAWLTRLLGGRRVEKILFAATKADHLHHSQHPQLTAIAEALLREAKDRAEFAGADTAAMSIAALRTTVEDRVDHNSAPLDVVRGRLLDSGKVAAFHPGALPDDPAHLLSPARDGAKAWLDEDYAVMQFAPQPLTLKPGDGPPHIRLDKAAQFLIGDRL
ncbi:YcjX family protein [Marivivens marinus]|uniref:YcjX family protein n=1 Tax=Marivivens marinus TaxID=3110173 RepID=UPI003B849359